MSTIEWINANREWLFNGLGAALVVLAIGGVVNWGRNRWRERQAIELIDGRMEISYRQPPSTVSRPFSTKLPRFVLRALYKPEEVQSKVKLDLRSNAPASVYLQGQIPYVELYFQITNLGPIDLVMDRLLVEVWFGQPTFTTALLHRYVIPAGEITDGLTVRETLSENQKAQIAAFQAADGRAGSIHVYLYAYFESKLGRLVVKQSIERQRI